MTSRPHPMSPTQAQEQRLLEAALALGTEAERRAFLEAVADPGARQRLEELIAASAEADSFFGAPPIQNAGAEFGEPAAPYDTAAEAPAQILGRYKLLEKIGEGGFGEVWMAEQREPVKRRVALKILKLGMDSRQIVARFEAERQALAMMDHPNIAKILDAGTTEESDQNSVIRDQRSKHDPLTTDYSPRITGSGRPYFVMELVRGTSITAYCDQNQLTTQQRLDLFIKVCQAIQHAHQKGIIHRDIKPSNILVTVNDGTAVPKVIDFGIAKAMQGELTDKTVFTQFQQFIGTPAYISPEQADMSSLDIDTRADIYSLGVLLYELLVGQTPFDAKEMVKGGIDALRKIIREKEPLRPSTKLNTLPGDARTTAGKRRQTDAIKLAHQLQGDLDWIVMKCLEKDRTRRYDTANGLAMDVQRHLANEPIVARPPNTAYKIQKAWQRNKLPFTAAAAVVLALLAGAVVSTWQALRATQAKQAVIAEQKQTEKARAEETQQRFRAEQESEEKGRALAAFHRSRYAADTVLAQQALAAGNLGRTRELLTNHLPKTGVEDLRGWEWRYLWGRSSSDELFTLGHHSNGVLCVASSWNGELLASGAYDRIVKLWDVPTRKLIAEIIQRDAIQCLAFSPTGNLLAIAAHGKNLGLWDIVSREEVWRIPMLKDLPAHPFSTSIAFDPQANGVLAVGDQSGGVTLWDTTTHAVLVSHPVLQAPVHALAYSGDGRRLAVASRDGRIQICDAHSLQTLVPLAEGPAGCESLAFSRDNRILASGGSDGKILLSSTESGSAVGRLTNHTAWVGGLAFLPDGRRLVSTSADHSIRFWDMTTQQEVARLKGHAHEVYRVVVSPDGERLVTASKDQSIKLWDAIPKPAPQTAFVVPAERFNHVVSADRRVFLSHLADGTMQLRNSKDLSLLRTFPSPFIPSVDDWYSAWALSPGGRTLAVGQDNGHVRLWNTADQKYLTDFAAHTSRITACRYSEDGRILATVGEDRKVRVWEIRTGKILYEYEAPPFAHRLYFSPNGGKLACTHWDEARTRGSVRVWDLKDRGEIVTIPAHLEQIWDIAFSPDGEMLVTGSPDSTAKLWDLNDVTQPKFVLRGRLLAVISLAFSPDGRRLAVSGDGGETKIWDVHSGQELLSLKGGDGFIRHTVFVDEETLLIASGTSGPRTELFLWHAPSMADIARTEAKEKSQGKQP